MSVNNLRHYFGTREGVLEAVLEAMGHAGKPYVAEAMGYTSLPVEQGLRTMVGRIVEGWTPEGLGGLHRSGISEGLGSEALGPAYVEYILEPTLVAVENMLGVWRDRKEVEVEDLRTAALGLMAPVVLALLHQRGLGGFACRPLDIEPFLDAHVAAFVRGYAPRKKLDANG